MKYSIVIPCYNESENLLDLVKNIKKIPSKYNVEFILVENGSTDNSKKIFKKMLESSYEKMPKKSLNVNIKTVFVDKNQGYGYGIIQGLKIAKGKYVGWFHADLQYNPVDLVSFFDYMDDHQKENILLKGKRKSHKLIEYLFRIGMSFYETLTFKKQMKDVMSMPVIFKRELLEYIDCFPYDFSIDIFVYALALKKNYKVVHLPIHLKNREKGESSWNNGLTSRIKLSKKMMIESRKIKKELDKIK